MSHNGNTELLLCLFRRDRVVQKRFPKLTDAQTEHIAAKRAKSVSGRDTMRITLSTE